MNNHSYIRTDTTSLIRSKNPRTLGELGTDHMGSTRLEDMHRKLKEHKRLVAVNLIKTHELEKSIQHTLDVERSSLLNLQEKLLPQQEKVEEWPLYLSDAELRTIERISRSRLGIGNVIQDSLKRYDDSKLRSELTALPIAMDDNVFVKIAAATSGGRISAFEARNMWRIHKNAHSRVVKDVKAGSDGDWGALRRALLKQIQTIFLVQEVIASGISHIRQAPFRLSSPQSPLHLSLSSSAPVYAVTGTPRSGRSRRHSQMTDQGREGVPLSLNPLRNQSKRSPKALSKGKNQGPQLQSHYSRLVEELSKSQETQRNMSLKLQSNLTSVSQTVIVGDRGVAKAFSKTVALRKLEKILQRCVSAYVALALAKWKEITAQLKLEAEVEVCMQYLAAYRALVVVRRGIKNKMRRYLHSFRHNVRIFDELEQWAAAVELQRCVRAKLARRRVNTIRWAVASIQIQRIVRGRKTRRLLVLKVRHHIMEKAAKVIQRVWKKSRLRRLVFVVLKELYKKRKTIMIQKNFRGFKARQLRKELHQAATLSTRVVQVQSAWRRYLAICFVEKRRHHHLLQCKVVIQQRIVRGFLARLFVKDLREMHNKATKIQSAWRAYLVRQELLRGQREVAAVLIQSAARRYLATKKLNGLREVLLLADLLMQRSAETICRIVLGFIDRRKYATMLREHHIRMHLSATRIQKRYRLHLKAKEAREIVRGLRHQRRLSAIRSRHARVLQRSMRRYHLAMQAYREYVLKQNLAATTLERVVRGFLGRRQAALLRIAAEELRERNRIPMYYRLKYQYYRDQNLFHRGQIVVIQCSYRCHRARVLLRILLEHREANKIQRWWQRIWSTKPYRMLLRQMRVIRQKRVCAAVHIQRIGRGFLAKRCLKRHYSSETVKWFIKNFKFYRIGRCAVENLRRRKRRHRRAVMAVTTLQAHFRGWQTRDRVRKQYQKLCRQRDRRRQKRELAATIRIQALARRLLARKLIRSRREEVEKIRKQKEAQEMLEQQVESLHEKHLLNVQATQIQSLSRQLLAKNKKKELYEEVATEAYLKEQEQIRKAATRIQAMARGVAGRSKFKKLLPLLRRAKQLRLLCAECERVAATKICRSCKDKFCDECHAKCHRKGQRRKHEWTYVPDYYPVAKQATAESQVNVGYAGINLSANKGTRSIDDGSTKRNKKSAWEEYYDEGSKKTYYHNHATGETTWTKPKK